MDTFNDSDRLRELASVRLIWVDTFVERKVNRYEGDFTTEQVEEWEREGYRRWRVYYPALNSLFPSHLPTAEAAS